MKLIYMFLSILLFYSCSDCINKLSYLKIIFKDKTETIICIDSSGDFDISFTGDLTHFDCSTRTVNTIATNVLAISLSNQEEYNSFKKTHQDTILTDSLTY